MSKCKRCSTSGIALKLDFDGYCQACHERFVKENDALIAELRAFKEDYMQIPNAREEAQRILAEARTASNEIISNARNSTIKEIKDAEESLILQERELAVRYKELERNTSTVKAEAEEFIAALLASSAKDFECSAKSKAPFPKSLVQKTSPATKEDLSFVSLTPSKFKRAARDGFVVFDVETTGLYADEHKIVEIGALRYDSSFVCRDRFHSLVNPGVHIPERTTKIHGIKDSDVANSPCISAVLPKLLSFIQGHPVIAHNAEFDMSFLKAAMLSSGITDPCTIEYCCSWKWAKRQLRLERYGLGSVAAHFGIGHSENHRSIDDCYTLGSVVKHLMNL